VTSSYFAAAGRALLVVLALAMAGCGTRGPSPNANPFDGQSGDATQIRVRVQNANFYDATVTVIGDTAQRRLGVVGGNSSATFTMAWGFSGGFRVQVDLLAGPSCTTDVIQVNPGDEVEFQIPSDLGVSGLCR
jgi:hypothetical protein